MDKEMGGRVKGTEYFWNCEKNQNKMTTKQSKQKKKPGER